MAICLEHNVYYQEADGFCPYCQIESRPEVYITPEWYLIDSNYFEEPLRTEWNIMRQTTKFIKKTKKKNAKRK